VGYPIGIPKAESRVEILSAYDLQYFVAILFENIYQNEFFEISSFLFALCVAMQIVK